MTNPRPVLRDAARDGWTERLGDAWRACWRKVPAVVQQALVGRSPVAATTGAISAARTSTRPGTNDMLTMDATSRFVLWIDAVGGFLVCLADRVVLGQAVPGGEADVPLLADVSRQHATIRRDREGYVLEPQREVVVNGQAVVGPVALGDEASLALGPAKLRFRRPHPLSASARLDPASRHLLHPAVDGVLLLAETCVLGPGPTCHVVCRGWPGEVILARRPGGLLCRTAGKFEVDGAAYVGAAPLGFRASASGEGFSFSLEPVEFAP